MCIVWQILSVFIQVTANFIYLLYSGLMNFISDSQPCTPWLMSHLCNMFSMIMSLHSSRFKKRWGNLGRIIETSCSYVFLLMNTLLLWFIWFLRCFLDPNFNIETPAQSRTKLEISHEMTIWPIMKSWSQNIFQCS